MRLPGKVGIENKKIISKLRMKAQFAHKICTFYTQQNKKIISKVGMKV
jgi:hypothetical protein